MYHRRRNVFLLTAVWDNGQPMKRILAVLGKEEGASLLQSSQRSSAPPYGTGGDERSREPAVLGSMRLLMSFAPKSRRPSLLLSSSSESSITSSASSSRLVLCRPLPARAVDRILTFLDARSRVTVTRLVSKSCRYVCARTHVPVACVSPLFLQPRRRWRCRPLASDARPVAQPAASVVHQTKPGSAQRPRSGRGWRRAAPSRRRRRGRGRARQHHQ